MRRTGLSCLAMLLLLAVAGCGAVGVGEPPAAATHAWQPPARPLAPGLSASDELIASAAMTVALERPDQGAPVAWRNPASRSSGSITVTRSFLAAPRPTMSLFGGSEPAQGEGLVCRQFDEQVSAAGRKATATDIACRVVDRWELVPVGHGWQPEPGRTYRAARSQRLSAIAKATEVPQAAIELLNPKLKDPVAAGTLLRLPMPR